LSNTWWWHGAALIGLALAVVGVVVLDRPTDDDAVVALPGAG
jgi:hypothetical protein